MNILYLHSHDTGRMIEPYGHAVRTPALQRLAEKGALFRNAHAAAPTCSPSRAALLTGEYAHQSGMVALAGRGGVLRRPERHLARLLGDLGFRTYLSGVSHVGPPEPCGYASIRDGSPRDGEATVRCACETLEAHATGGARTEPFFLDVGFVETHRTEWVSHGFNQPHHEPHDGDGDPSYVRPPAPLPDVADTRRDWLDFQYSVERLDAYYGRVLDALEHTGLAEDTLVIATTDHGVAFPDMKCRLTAHGTGVLLLLRLPEVIPEGFVSDVLVSHMDIYPTLCELLGVPAPEWLQGTSLLPHLSGGAASVREDVFAEVTFHAAFEPMRAVRTSRWSYIRSFGLSERCPLANVDDGHSKRFLLEAGVLPLPTIREQLFDLIADPFERRNLASDPGYAVELEEMRGRLEAWMRRTDDPILADDPSVLPLPQRVNPPDAPGPGPDTVTWDPDEWRSVVRGGRTIG